MEDLKNWMVGLDLTGIDHSILRYTKMLSDVLKPQRIEFVHMAPWLPDHVSSLLIDQLKVPDYDDLLAQVEAEVYKYFDVGDPVSCEVLEGSVQFNLWQETFVKQIDLFIAGSKEKHKGRGLFPKKFVRKSVCSVLFIPGDIPDTLNKIWVPVDFSDASGEALTMALHLAETMSPQGNVQVHHIYELPHAYYYEGFPRDEIMRAVREEAEKEFTNFNEKFNPYHINIAPVYTPMSQSYAAEHIQTEAEKNQASLIMMASGGRSRFSKFFLGSETEMLVQLEKKIPLWVLKKRKDHLKIRDLINI